MTLEKRIYVERFEKAYGDYVYDLVKKRKYRSNVDKFNDEIKLSLFCCLAEIILSYYRDTIEDDDNFFTEVQIQVVINMFNSIAEDANVSYQIF